MQNPNRQRQQLRAPTWWQYAAVVFGVLVFGLIFLTFADVLNEAGGYFAVVPIVLAAWFIGLGAALLVGVLCLFILQPLLFWVCGFEIIHMVTDPVVAVGIIISLIVAVAGGTIRALVDRVNQLKDELERLDRTDYLTNLLNRRAFLETGERELKRAFRAKNDVVYYLGRAPQPQKNAEGTNEHKNRCTIDDYLGVFSCAIIDLDLFKRVNDTFGTAVGDEVLRKVGHLLSHEECLRESDIAGRMGGEEFIVLLPGTSSSNALFPMERVRSLMEGHTFSDENGATFTVTISGGISQLKPEDRSIDDVLRRASAALAYAKEHGRNRVAVYEKDVAPPPHTTAAAG